MHKHNTMTLCSIQLPVCGARHMNAMMQRCIGRVVTCSPSYSWQHIIRQQTKSAWKDAKHIAWHLQQYHCIHLNEGKWTEQQTWCFSVRCRKQANLPGNAFQGFDCVNGNNFSAPQLSRGLIAASFLWPDKTPLSLQTNITCIIYCQKIISPFCIHS